MTPKLEEGITLVFITLFGNGAYYTAAIALTIFSTLNQDDFTHSEIKRAEIHSMQCYVAMDSDGCGNYPLSYLQL